MRFPFAGMLLALALVSCGSPPPQDVFLYGRGADSEKLDPQDIEDGESVKVCNQIFENLVTYKDDSAELQPWLATKWDVAEEGKEWTFTLRSGVRFHDGSPFDADAVVFSLRRLYDEELPERKGLAVPYSASYEMIRSVEKIDATHVRVVLSGPSAVFLANLAMFPAAVVNPKSVREAGKDVAERPVGTGPYRFVRWDRNDRISLERNDDYWGTKPPMRRLIFRSIRENSVRLQLLRNGEIHLMDGVSLSDTAAIEADKDLRLLRAEGMNFGYLAFNTSRPPFDDARVRRAVALAVDKKKVLQLAYDGQGKTGPHPLPPTVPGYARDIEDYPHDPAEARRLLAEAGLPEGTQVTLWTMPNPRPYMPEPQDVAQVIQESLREAGLEVEIPPPLDWEAYRARIRQGEHQMCLLGWITDNGDPDNFLHALFHSSNAEPGKALNISFFRNPEYDRLVDAAQVELDVTRRMSLYHQAQELLHREAPVLPLAYLPELAAARANVIGYRPHPVGVVRLGKVGFSVKP